MSNELHLETIAGYLAAWQEKNPGRRQEVLRRVFAQNGTFEDPVASIVGRDAFEKHIIEFQSQFPDATSEIISTMVDAFHLP